MGSKRAEKYSPDLPTAELVSHDPKMQCKLGPYNKKAGPEARLHYCMDSEARSEKQTTYVAEQPIHLCKEATCITTINRTVIVRQAEWQH